MDQTDTKLDSSGEGYTGILAGPPLNENTTPSPPGTFSSDYFNFDGVGDKMRTGIQTPNPFGDATMSLVWWGQPTSLTVTDMAYTVTDQSGTDRQQLRIVYAGATAGDPLSILANFDVTDGGWTTDTAYQVNVWAHYAVTYNNSATTNDPVVYFDGVAQAITETATPDATYVAGGDQIEIGETNVGTSFSLTGYQDETAYFNEILTSTDVNNIIDFGLDGSGGARRIFLISENGKWVEKTRI